MSMDHNRRVLVIDDDPQIIEFYKQVLSPQADAMDGLFAALSLPMEEVQESSGPVPFDVTVATQGRDGFEIVRQAMEENSPFAVIIVDMRMPPGWNGHRTAKEIRAIDPDSTIVIATAFSDINIYEIHKEIGEGILYKRKPIDGDELYLLVSSLCLQWQKGQERQQLLDSVNQMTTALLNEVASHREARQELEFRDNHDTLTQLPNRSLMKDRIHQSVLRQDGNPNGWIRGYEVFVSEDGESWGEPRARGEFEQTADPKTVRFSEPAICRFVKLVARSAFDEQPFASLAELEVLEAPRRP